jgi:DNA-binding MarR family transcriptional regulator
MVLPVYELNGEFLAAAKDIAEPAGLTPAWWQVLGATSNEPLPVAEIARRVGLGLARQSVQRTADLLVQKGWAVYRDNPHHRRAKLLEPTPAGRETVRRLRQAQHAWADAVGNAVGAAELRAALTTVRKVIDASRAQRAATYTTVYFRAE